MIKLGTPELNNLRQIDRIKRVSVFKSQVINLDEDFYAQILNKDMRVLDVGKSLRDKSGFVSSKVSSLETLDINASSDYPDIQMDLCEKLEVPSNLRYDLIFCFSLLEHCYNPFTAANNLYKLLKQNSRIIGSVPFLFPHHCPKDLVYQDYFRFTKDSFIALFPDAKKIEVRPHRGRIGAGLNIISQRYKDIFEKSLPRLASHVNSLDQSRRPEQSSGFHFEVFN